MVKKEKKADAWPPFLFADEIEQMLKGKDKRFVQDVTDYWYRFTKQGRPYLKARKGRPAVRFIIHFLDTVEKHVDTKFCSLAEIERQVSHRLYTKAADLTRQ